MSKEPKLEDFYDVDDPRGCSLSEYEDFVDAHERWEEECDQFELGFCTNCFQMTNHINGICQKCKSDETSKQS